MRKNTQEGDSIAGEKIVFQCRDYKINRKLIQISGQHRGKSGCLFKATCIIERKFRFIPNKKKQK